MKRAWHGKFLTNDAYHYCCVHFPASFESVFLTVLPMFQFFSWSQYVPIPAGKYTAANTILMRYELFCRLLDLPLVPLLHVRVHFFFILSRNTCNLDRNVSLFHFNESFIRISLSSVSSSMRHQWVFLMFTGNKIFFVNSVDRSFHSLVSSFSVWVYRWQRCRHLSWL